MIMTDKAYIQLGKGKGPFVTISAPIKHEGADKYKILFEGRWRKIHIQTNRLYVVYMGEKLTVNYEGI